MSQGYYNNNQGGGEQGPPGTLGGYTLIELIGRGGMGEVWRAEREGPQGYRKRAAIKRILARFQNDPTLRARFVAEARTNARLEHPNIVQVLDFGEQPEPYLALEFVEGSTVARVLKLCAETGQRIPPAAVLYIIAEAAKGLDYAHRKRDENGQPLGIVHRDVSPQNLLLSVDGAVKVSDFGIARAADNSLRTQQGVQVGKLSYMSPEQAQGVQVDHRADVFSLGIVLWETLLVRPLLPRNDPNTAMQLLMSGNFTPPSQIDPRISPVIDQLVMSALAVNPAQRTASAGDLAAQLQTFVHAISPGFDGAELVRVLATVAPNVPWQHQNIPPRPASLLWAPGGAAPQAGGISYADGGDGATQVANPSNMGGGAPARQATLPPMSSGGIAAMGAGGLAPIAGAGPGGALSGGQMGMGMGMGGLPPSPGAPGGGGYSPTPSIGLGGMPPSGGAGGFGGSSPLSGGLGAMPPLGGSPSYEDRASERDKAKLPSVNAPPPKPIDPNRRTHIITASIIVVMLGLVGGALMWLMSGSRDPASRPRDNLISIVPIDPTTQQEATGDSDAQAATTQTSQVTQGARVPAGYELRAVRAVQAVEPQVLACFRTNPATATAVSTATDFDNASGGAINVTLDFGDAGVTSPPLRLCIEGALLGARFTPDANVTGITRVLRGWRVRRGGGGGGGGGAGGGGGGGGGGPAFPFGSSPR